MDPEPSDAHGTDPSPAPPQHSSTPRHAFSAHGDVFREGFAPQKARFSADARGSDPPPRSALPVSPALRAQQSTALKRRLAAHLEGNIELVITDNRSVMVSVRRLHTPARSGPARGHSTHTRRPSYAVRLHHLFADAPEPLLRSLARYISYDCPDASRQLSAYIDANEEHVAEPSAPAERAVVLRTQGKIYDLAEIAARLNKRYFDGRVEAQITWGRNAARGRARRSVRLGSYCVEDDLIRIHPGLDQRWVPDFYVEWVVYHEMLHAMHPIERVGGRRVFHSEAFLADERRFEDYERAHAWERRSIAALLSI
ncbi:MAG: hypothetical protein KC503_14255 [Myxococcales bacterium]|nr:hypothetical protein [Myxococcales bacterium]